jgi:hypothetical protein
MPVPEAAPVQTPRLDLLLPPRDRQESAPARPGEPAIDCDSRRRNWASVAELTIGRPPRAPRV